MAGRRHEKPLRRRNPSGEIVWVARFTGRDGKRRSAGTFKRKGPCPVEEPPPVECCAQHAIDAAYDEEYSGRRGSQERDTVGGYFEPDRGRGWPGWLGRYPRGRRTETTYKTRIKAVLDVRLEGKPLRDWRMMDVRRREAADLLDVLLRKQGRAASGARGVLSTLSAMWEDAITDDRCELNPFLGMKVRGSDPRVQKAPRGTRVYSWEQMHEFAAAAPTPVGRASIRCLSDLGLRIGEMLPLERADVMYEKCADLGCDLRGAPHVHVCKTADEGIVEPGVKMHRGGVEDGRAVPLGDGLAGVLRALPPRLETRLLLPYPRTGRVMHQRSFYRDVWEVCREAVPSMAAAIPHDFRHSYVSHMRAAGVDPADLAEWTGHTVATATAKYTHSTGTSRELLLQTLAKGA
jgi:integrase